jgi:hypothetical protein
MPSKITGIFALAIAEYSMDMSPYYVSKDLLSSPTGVLDSTIAPTRT